MKLQGGMADLENVKIIRSHPCGSSQARISAPNASLLVELSSERVLPETGKLCPFYMSVVLTRQYMDLCRIIPLQKKKVKRLLPEDAIDLGHDPPGGEPSGEDGEGKVEHNQKKRA